MPKSTRSKSASARRRTVSRSKPRTGSGPSSRARTRTGPKAAATRARRSAVTARRTTATRSSDRGPAIDRALRDLLVRQLEGGHAYTTFAEAIRDFPAELRGVRPGGAAHSAWQVLEHLRISQWDIVDFTRNPDHRSPAWPAGYWPENPEPPNDSAWEKSVREFERELDAMKRLITDPRRDLFAKIDHPEAQAHHTLARESMVLSEHNGYHIAELILLRRVLGAWSRS
jgi:hypothetical protein